MQDSSKGGVRSGGVASIQAQKNIDCTNEIKIKQVTIADKERSNG